jgi:hypothetical protein
MTNTRCTSFQVLKLCLDVSLLGLEPIHAEATVLPSGPAPNGQDGCPAGQQLSSLLNVCVDQKFFSKALGDNQCAHGWKLDLVSMVDGHTVWRSPHRADR